MACPAFTNTAEKKVSTESQLRNALMVEGHTWIRLTANITLTQELDLTPLVDCPNHQFIRIEADTDTNPSQMRTLTKGFSGGAMIAWRQNRFGVDQTVTPNKFFTMHLSLRNLIFDGASRSGNLVEIHESDASFYRNCTFKNSGGDGLVIGPPTQPAGDYAVPESVGPNDASCADTYQNSMMLILDCIFDSNVGVGLRLTGAIDVTVLDGGTNGNATDLSFVGPSHFTPLRPPPNQGCDGSNKFFLGVGSIVGWNASNAFLNLVYGIHTAGSMPPASVSTGNSVACLDLNP